MIIGIDASRANKKEKTGTEWYSYHLIKKFSEIDKKDKFILYTREPLRTDLGNLGKNFFNRELKWPPHFLWSQIRLSWEMLFNQPELLFVPAHTIPIIQPNRTVTTCHDVGFEEFPELYAKKRIGDNNLISKIIGLVIKIITIGKYSNNELDYHRFSMRLAVKKAKVIITPSQFTSEQIVKYYNVKKEKIITIPLGYNKKYKVIDDKLKIGSVLKELSISQPFFIFVGRLERKKNIVGLIKSFYIFKKKYKTDHKLVLIGSEGEGWKEANDFIERKNIKKDVLKPGWLEVNKISALYNAATALVFVSYYEGFGIPPLEAMACGLPVICSNRGSLPEVVGSAGLFSNPNDHELIAEHMLKIAKDKDMQNKLKEEGFRNLKKYSWEICAKKTLEVILES